MTNHKEAAMVTIYLQNLTRRIRPDLLFIFQLEGVEKIIEGVKDNLINTESVSEAEIQTFKKIVAMLGGITLANPMEGSAIDYDPSTSNEPTDEKG